jgi:hypothetical protein
VSDVSQGPGWWRASDGLYYPPEARPSNDPTNAPPADDGAPTEARSELDEARPELDETIGADPAGEPTIVSETAAIGGDDPHDPYDDPGVAPYDEEIATYDEDVETDERRRRGWLIPVVAVVVLLAIAGAVAAWILLGDDDDEPNVATPTSTTEDDDPDTATTDPDAVTTTTVDDDQVSAFDLGEGDCFDTVDVDEGDGLVVTTVQLVDCDDEHQAEIFAVEALDTPAGEPFPGAEARDQAAQELCAPGFEEFVGVPLAESELLLLWLAPTEESWDDDDREVACAVAAPDGESLTGTAEGAAR